MKERPILFSGPMVRAILEGRKTQTRRIIKNTEFYACLTGDCPHWDNKLCAEAMKLECPKGKPGDQLWVRENFYLTDDGDNERAVYDTDELEVARHINEVGQVAARHGLGNEWLSRHTKLRPSIHMPRWASRINLLVKNVRVECLQDITEADARAEGMLGPQPILEFAFLWEEINGGKAWDANPWVWVIEFNAVVTI